ncbi:MAG: hypothetical protein F6K19_23465 [Cyanothece sp. SIO1E1]|nr:hypothetical protein [Cyanothece sp. SIO1E1]
MKVQLCPKGATKTLLFILGLLLSANILAITFRYFPDTLLTSALQLFDFNTENSFPTLYSFIILLLSAGLLGLIGMLSRQQGKRGRGWFILSLVFLFLAVDETLMIHEALMVPVRETLNTTGFLYYAWIIPYSILLVLLFFILLPFIVKLPNDTRRNFFLAGFIFVAGAIGVEAITGWHVTAAGDKNLVYEILYTIEELLEMVGIVLFIYALLNHISRYTHLATIIVGKKMS